jgi:DNA-binding winged helix-turn-helix (wHTH) protein
MTPLAYPVKITITPRARTDRVIAILTAYARRSPGVVVPYSTLYDKVFRDQFHLIADPANSLQVAVRRARVKLGDKARIVTVPKRGYYIELDSEAT